MKKLTLVPDTSVIINGEFLKYISEQSSIDTIILSRVVLAEIEHMANQTKIIGMASLEELKTIRNYCSKHQVILSIEGNRPTSNDIRYAKLGELDAQIRYLAEENNGTLVTADRIQSEIAVLEGLEVIFLKEKIKSIGKKIEDFFDDKTMSVHLREKNPPLAKKGAPGSFQLISLSNEVLTRENLEELSKDIIERANRDPDSFVESDQHGSTVIQLQKTRIIITRPPFSDAMEITAVHPILKRTIKEYNLEPQLLKRIEEMAEGIIVAGAPGAGKSTFATAVAELYADKDKIVKTFENPRDLQVDDRITQLGGFEGDISESADLVLLMRPDYVIFDELRKTKDFETYADLRLAGIGLIGVLHATQPIDGIQRFIKRVDLGIIPSIVDTVIYISEGEVNKVFTLQLTVKVPTGMTEKDLARPVIEVTDFYSNSLLYEIYSFGEQIVVAPIKKNQKAKMLGIDPSLITPKSLRRILKRYAVSKFEYNFEPPNNLTLYVKENDKPKIIGRSGKKIAELEGELGLSITVSSLAELKKIDESAEFVLNIYESKSHINLVFPDVCIGRDVSICVNGEIMIELTVGKTGEIKLTKDSELGKILINAHNGGSVISAIM